MASRQLDELVAAGLTDIVDVRLEWNVEHWVTEAQTLLGYRWLGVGDAGQRMPDDWFDLGTDHVLERLAAGATVLTHCHMGINRGPSLGYAALLASGWEQVEGLDARMRRTGGSAGTEPTARNAAPAGTGFNNGAVPITWMSLTPSEESG